jgi:alpha-beta hydrolase superfamily lysophospholipase
MRMKKLCRYILVFASFGIVPTLCFGAENWTSDLLGDGYEMRYVTHPDDYSGKVRSTIIRKISECNRHRAVLYVHGYNDYFFQREEGNRFADSCYNFYAVDLRKYGRSILPGQTKFQARNIDEYFADIDSAIAQIKRDGNDKIVIMGHSTGGLITSAYMNRKHDKSIKGLVLNSPFLEWNLSWFTRHIAIPIVRLLSKIFPNMSISQGNNNAYAQSLLKKYHGEWDYNTDWKTDKPEPVQASWINAISGAQNSLDDSDITEPILLMHSDKSVDDDDWSEAYQHADGVLNVHDISDKGVNLGRNVKEHTVEGGMHDLMLSPKDAREDAYKAIFEWLHNQGM